MTSRGFVVIYGVANLGLVLYGLLAVFHPSTILAPISLNLSPIPAEPAPLTSYIRGLIRLLGFFNILVGSVGIVLLRASRYPGQRWAARPLILVTLLAYIGPIVFDNTVGHVGEIEVLEIVILLTALLAGILHWTGQRRSSAA